MAKARTRFVIRSNNQVSEIFAIIERKSGDLILIPKSAAHIFRKGGPIDGLTENRISVHVSPKSIQSGPTIVRHVRTVSGYYERVYAKVSCSGDGLLFPVVVTLSQDLFREHYACSAKSADKIIYLGEYCPYTSALLYVVIVSDYNALAPSLAPYLNHAVLRLSHFAVHVFWGFIPMTSTSSGYSLYPETALTLEKDGKHVQGYCKDALYSRTPEQLKDWVYQQISTLVDYQAELLAQASEKSSDPVSVEDLGILKTIGPLPPHAPPEAVLRQFGLSLDTPSVSANEA